MWFIALAHAAEEEVEVCASFGEVGGPAEVIVDDTVGEIQSSGIAASRSEDGVYYTHDDAGGEAKLYVFRDSGDFVGAQVVKNATNTDWEDLASGPCPSSVDADHCLWIADIGDNDDTRTSISVWVVPESLDATVDAVECPLVYPEGKRHDAEALLVSPDGTLRIVTKEPDEAKIYRLSNPVCNGGAAQTLEKEAEIILGGDKVTGGAVSLDGKAVVLRSLTQAWIWTGCAWAWTDPPQNIDLGNQPQGEAVAFTNDGGLITTSEVQAEGEPLRYWTTPCAETETLVCETCGCDEGAAAVLLLPLAGLVRRRRR